MDEATNDWDAYAEYDGPPGQPGVVHIGVRTHLPPVAGAERAALVNAANTSQAAFDQAVANTQSFTPAERSWYASLDPAVRASFRQAAGNITP